MPILKLFFQTKIQYFVLLCVYVIATNQKFGSNVADQIKHFIDGKCDQHS